MSRPPTSSRSTLPSYVTAAVAVLALLTGCSGDDAAQPTVPSPITSDTLFTSTTEPRATTTPSTLPPTIAPATTPTTSSTSLPISPSTTATTLVDSDEQAVVDAARASWLAYIEAIRDPGSDATVRELVETKRDAALDSSVRVVEELVAFGQRAIPNDDVPAVFVPRVESVAVNGASAQIEYCWVGSDIIVETGGNADGSDRVINDDIVIFVERDDFEFIEGRWRKVGGTVLEQIEGEFSCDTHV